MVEIDEIVDGGASNASSKELIVIIGIKTKMGSGVEVVFPTEMVGMIGSLKPGGRLPTHIQIDN